MMITSSTELPPPLWDIWTSTFRSALRVPAKAKGATHNAAMVENLMVIYIRLAEQVSYKG
jgi:hypothetical protein